MDVSIRLLPRPGPGIWRRPRRSATVVVVTTEGPKEAASTPWNDYLGTVAADDAPVLSHEASLYEIVGLDRDHWTVVGVDLDVKAKVPELTILAAARGPDAARVDDLVDDSGTLPVTAFSITDPQQVEKFFTEAFGQLSIRLRPRHLTHPVQIIERGAPHQAAPSEE